MHRDSCSATRVDPDRCVLEHEERYDIITLMMKSGTFMFYNKSVGTFYRAIYSMRVCISHYLLLL